MFVWATFLSVPSSVKAACPGEQTTDRGNDLDTSFTWTGQGGYAIAYATVQNPLVLSGVPAGATIIKAYLWGTDRHDGAGCDLSLEFGGSEVAGGLYLLLIEAEFADGTTGESLERLVIVR